MYKYKYIRHIYLDKKSSEDSSSSRKKVSFSHCCCCSDAKSCPTLCSPLDCSMPGFPLLHCLLEFAWIHVYWICDAIWPSHPLPPSSFAFSLFPSTKSLFQWVDTLSENFVCYMYIIILRLLNTSPCYLKVVEVLSCKYAAWNLSCSPWKLP